MKWIGRILFIFLVFIIGISVIQSSKMKQRFKYYETEGVKALEENDLEKFLDIYFTASLADKNREVSFLKNPVYHAAASNDNINYDLYMFQTNSIIKTKKEDINEYITWFYFNDNIEDYSVLLDNENDHKLLKEPFTRLLYVIDVEVEGDENKIQNYFPINPLQKYIRIPIPLLQNKLDENGNNIFKYVNDSKSQNVKETNLIKNISIKFVLENSNLEKPIEKQILDISHNDKEFNGVDNLVLEDGIFVSNNFNGSSTQYDYSESFKDQTLINVLDHTKLDPYKGVVTKAVLTYSAIVAVITYLLFFLRPTIDFFRNRKYEKEKALKKLNPTDE